MTADGLLSKKGPCIAFSDYLSLLVIRPFLIRSSTKPGGATGQSSAPFDAHAQLRTVDHDRASINRTSTDIANRHVAMIGTYGETIPVEGFLDRCFLMRPSIYGRVRMIMAAAIIAAKLTWLKKFRLWINGHTFRTQPPGNNLP
jgi:hypothetical protein